MSIGITEKAQKIISDKLNHKNKENTFLRIFVQGIGWGGPVFGITLEGSKDNEEDYEEEINEIKVIVNKDLLKQFDSFLIDYSTGWFNKGFSVIPGAGGSHC